MKNISHFPVVGLASALALVLQAGHSSVWATQVDCSVAQSGCIDWPITPALALARDYEPGQDLSGYWVSEKLDGVRAYWDGHRLLTRRGNPIHAPAWFVRGLPSRPLDGELWAGRGNFQTLVSIVRDREPDEVAWREVSYQVFDLPGSEAVFSERLALLRKLLAETDNPRVKLVGQQRLAGEGSLERLMWQVIDAGGEGLMLRREAAPYRAGRVADLLKYKRHQDAEARVLAHLPGKGKYRGMMGSLLVEDGEGRRFRIGTGFSDAERRQPPSVGSLITFRYHGRTDRGIPRFASYLREREDY